MQIVINVNEREREVWGGVIVRIKTTNNPSYLGVEINRELLLGEREVDGEV